MTIRVLLAEDQAMVRGALSALLALEGDIAIVAEAARGDAVLPAALDARPDVALLDIEMPGGDGLAAAAALREEVPTCAVIILTTFARAGYLKRAMESGARGFLLKDAPPAELAAAVRRVMAGERVVDPDLALSALSGGDSPLTDRERDVLRASADGAAIGDVASALFLSEGTCGIISPRRSRNWGCATGWKPRGSPSGTAGCRAAELARGRPVPASPAIHWRCVQSSADTPFGFVGTAASGGPPPPERAGSGRSADSGWGGGRSPGASLMPSASVAPSASRNTLKT